MVRLPLPSRVCSFAAPVWVTTRDPRPGEVDGEDVTFIEDFAFQVLKEQDRLLVSYQVCFLCIFRCVCIYTHI